MKIDEVFILFKNSGKYFSTYEEAFKNGKYKPGQEKQVYYVFTPTMQEVKRVSELENVARKYFNKTFDCDYFDIFRKQLVKQFKLF